MKKFWKKWMAKGLMGVFLWMLTVPGVFALEQGPDVYVTDTVAGYSALIRVANAPSQTDLEIQVEKPNGSSVLLEAKSDTYGKAKIDLDGFFTKNAGQYNARAQVKGGNFGSSETFYVYPDAPSPHRSQVTLSRETAAANGNDYVELIIELKDQYANPIAGHSVDVLSSRKEDEIIRISNRSYTNEQGQMVYNIYSREAGVSTLLIHDATENITLNQRPKIAFYAPYEKATAQGGNRVFLAASQAGPVSTLAIEGLEPTVVVGKPLNFTVTAYDQNGMVVNDFMNKIRLSSTDNNANLPDDYQFQAEDQGQHTFSLGLSFQTTGIQTLTATDISSPLIFGEKEVAVTSQGTGQSNIQTGSGTTSTSSDATGAPGLNIFTPAAGTYSSDKLTFSGEATYGLIIEIFDGDHSVGETPVKANGEFTTIVSGLQDGQHQFTIKAKEGNGSVQQSSTPVQITIDTNAPELEYIQINPTGSIPTKGVVNITAFTESNLPKVSVVFNNGIFEMSEDLVVDGVYKVEIAAPNKPGDYSIDLLLVDELGNEILSKGAAILNVYKGEEGLLEDESTDEEEEDEEDSEILTYPGKVTGVEAVAGDKRITLSWEAPTAPTYVQAGEIVLSTPPSEAIVENSLEQLSEEEHTLFEALYGNEWTEEELEEKLAEFEGILEEFGIEFLETLESLEELENLSSDERLSSDEPSIAHYRIYYGPSPDLMYSSIDTLNSSTTWYIPDLVNGNLYYFAVVARTADGMESFERSDVVSGTPESDEDALLFAAAEEVARQAAEEKARADALAKGLENGETLDTGPEVFWLLALSVMFGYGYFKRERKTSTLEKISFQDIR